jgi:hypothetical protein
MELPWNLCPFCGTPAPGVRRENLTLDEALSSLSLDLGEGEAEIDEEVAVSSHELESPDDILDQENTQS